MRWWLNLEPVDPFEGGEFEVIEPAPWSFVLTSSVL